MQTIRLGLEWFLNPDHVPFLLAEEYGWFREAGLVVELVEPAAHLDALAEIQAGRMDVAVTEPIHLVEDRAKGESVVGFARFLHTNGGVMYLAGRGIDRPRDMANVRVQYPGAPGPGGPAIVRTMIEADGGEAGTLQPVNNSFYHTDALLEDKADVATLIFRNFEIVEAHHRGHDARYFALKDWGIPDFCQLILITTPALLAERREAFQALVLVLRRGIDFIKERPDAAAAVYAKRAGVAPDDALAAAITAATLPCFTHDLSMSADYYGTLQRWMHARGLIARTVDAADYWTNAFALPGA